MQFLILDSFLVNSNVNAEMAGCVRAGKVGGSRCLANGDELLFVRGGSHEGDLISPIHHRPPRALHSGTVGSWADAQWGGVEVLKGGLGTCEAEERGRLHNENSTRQ